MAGTLTGATAAAAGRAAPGSPPGAESRIRASDVVRDLQDPRAEVRQLRLQKPQPIANTTSTRTSEVTSPGWIGVRDALSAAANSVPNTGDAPPSVSAMRTT